MYQINNLVFTLQTGKLELDFCLYKNCCQIQNADLIPLI